MSSLRVPLITSLMSVCLLLLLVMSSSSTNELFFASAFITVDKNGQPVVHGLECVDDAVGVWETAKSTETGEERRVASFRGLRFAEPPVRFAPPEPLKNCSSRSNKSERSPRSAYNATYFRSVCSQLTLGIFKPASLIGSEDCLFINVYVPERIIVAKEKKQKQTAAVFVFISGGSFVFGGGSTEKLAFFSAFSGKNKNTSSSSFSSSSSNNQQRFGGDHDDDDGLIVVTFNYRLSLLGWMAAPVFDSFNLGLQDQIVAFKWVQRNIAAFLGDPTRVTLGGQSSSSTAIYALLSSKKTAGLFRGAIALSGSPNITMDKATKLKQDAPILDKLGCGGCGRGGVRHANHNHEAKNKTAIMACLRSLPVEKIFAAVPESWNWNTPGAMNMNNLNPVTGRNYIGIIFVDGEIVAAPFHEALSLGINRNVSLIMSNMGQEANMELVPNKMLHVDTMAEWRTVLKDLFSKFGSSSSSERSASSEIADELSSAYRLEAAVSPLMAYDSIQGDYSVTCPNVILATSRRLHRRGTDPSFSDDNDDDVAPIYISVNQWPPSSPGEASCSLVNKTSCWMTFAYHLWDWTSATDMWDIMDFIPYKPQAADFALGRMMRAQFFEFMTGFMTGRMDDRVDPPWWPANNDNDEKNSSSYRTFVYSRADRFPYRKSGTVEEYKKSQCELIENKIGLGQRFWWCN